jgi:predicted  nucleic acid-binding Zn-ribbon protein
MPKRPAATRRPAARTKRAAPLRPAGALSTKQQKTKAIGAKISKPEQLRLKLLRQQPHARSLLDRLAKELGEAARHGPFALIEHGHCSACSVTIAAKPLQQALNGEFINCASCLRFLYIEAAG